MRAFSSPICWRWPRNAARRRRLKGTQHRIISGTQANRMRVSATLLWHRMMKDTTILMPAMKNSSGQWWENSVTSNRSLVMRPMIWPTLVLE